jgi:histidinol phosphatase-like enzyme (inositol monophosphatase family)
MTPVDFSAFVDELATRSGTAILPFFRSAIAARDKSQGGAFDPVTEADRAGEVTMRQMIKASFPNHGIIGEEYGEDQPDAEFVWVLDPIDGTKSFICGMPAWGTLIGLLHGGRPVFGMMHQPFTRERFSGNGGSATYRGPTGERELHTRRCGELAEATLATTSPLLLQGTDLDAFRRVEAKVKLSRYGGDCYAYCMLAAGHIDLVIESGLKPYDIVGLIPIITGAGGVVTTWDGGDPAGGGAIVAASDPRLHQQALDRLQG